MCKYLIAVMLLSFSLISVYAEYQCYSCDGTGVITCNYCKGTGCGGECVTCNGTGFSVSRCLMCGGDGYNTTGMKCFSCKGTGVRYERCMMCKGSGCGHACFTCRGRGVARCNICQGTGQR